MIFSRQNQHALSDKNIIRNAVRCLRFFQSGCRHEEARKSVLGKNYQWLNEERNMAQHINLALTDLMIEYPHLMLFGEDIAKKGLEFLKSVEKKIFV